jgi:sterol desaturase/sphingolipid hydroxylase (fatty acid hydroxylase superfamily)
VVSVALIVILGSLLVVALWEFCRPRRRREFPALRRRLANLGFWTVNLLIGVFFSPPDSGVRSAVTAVLGVGLPSWPIADQWSSYLAAFLLLDFLSYALHRCQHAVPFLWRFHAVHHSDPDVDVTTSIRHHPIELLLAAGFFWLAVLALDIPVVAVMSYTPAVFAAAALTHGNISLPEWLERLLRPVVITLDLHLVHHSMVYDEANANFGAVLSIWDRLFGTYAQITRAQRERLVFGVRELPRRDCLKPSAMLLTPWRLARARAAAGAGD